MSISGIFPIDMWDFKSQSILTDLPIEDFKDDGILKTKGRKIIVLDVQKLILLANYR